MSTRLTPQEAWDDMLQGNDRFVTGAPQHPRQNVERRNQVSGSQNPDAALFGCSDSRLAAEIIFDRGLGDLFVVRNAGHIVSDSSVASLEYAVVDLDISLITVLAHDSCGAVAAAIDRGQQEPSPLPEKVAQLIDPIIPAVQEVWFREHSDSPYVDPARISAEEVGRLHLRHTVASLLRSSKVISDRVAAGELGIVGCQYRLVEGRAEPVSYVGPLRIDLPTPGTR